MATAQPQPQRMTAEAFDAAFGESEREDRAPGADLELVDGVVVEGEMPNRRHQIVVARLHAHIEPWATRKGGGAWIDPDLRLGPLDVRCPDLIAWWSGQTVPLDEQMHDVPDLVIEVLSARPRDVRRDSAEKPLEYCRFGIPHYWVVEPLHHQFDASLRVRAGDGWVYTRTHFGTRGSIQPFVGPALDLDALFRDL